MYGDRDSEKDMGLVPRTVRELFKLKDKDVGRFEIKIKATMSELYLNDLQDLLLGCMGTSKKPKGALEIKKDARGTVYVENITEI